MRAYIPLLLVAGLLASCAAPEAREAERDQAPQQALGQAPIKTLEFEVLIEAPPQEVWEHMLSPDGYTQWTAPFSPGSVFQGTWGLGERMHFLGPNGTGMVAEVAAFVPARELSLRHIGYVIAGVEDTTSEGVKSWAPAHENYYLEPVAGGTRVRVEQETLATMESMISGIWPQALGALKDLCEAP